MPVLLYVILKANPGCVSDSWRRIVLYEWNDDGLLVNIDEIFSKKDFEKSLAPCMEQDEHLRASKGDLGLSAEVSLHTTRFYTLSKYQSKCFSLR